MLEVDESASAGSSAPLFPGPGVSLTDLLENDSRHILARLGGTCLLAKTASPSFNVFQ